MCFYVSLQKTWSLGFMLRYLTINSIESCRRWAAYAGNMCLSIVLCCRLDSWVLLQSICILNSSLACNMYTSFHMFIYNILEQPFNNAQSLVDIHPVRGSLDWHAQQFFSNLGKIDVICHGVSFIAHWYTGHPSILSLPYTKTGADMCKFAMTYVSPNKLTVVWHGSPNMSSLVIVFVWVSWWPSLASFISFLVREEIRIQA